jgi:hypothetical protein
LRDAGVAECHGLRDLLGMPASALVRWLSGLRDARLRPLGERVMSGHGYLPREAVSAVTDEWLAILSERAGGRRFKLVAPEGSGDEVSVAPGRKVDALAPPDDGEPLIQRSVVRGALHEHALDRG